MRAYIFLLTFLPFICKASAKDTTEANKSLLWRVSSTEMKKPSYLFGTIHLICTEDYLWTTAMENSLTASDAVCFEMDMDDPSLMMQVATGMIETNGKQLKDYFTEKEYQQLAQFLSDSLHMNISMFEQMKPAALEMLFATRIVDCASSESYESNILTKAQKAKKEIEGLEDVKEQIALLDSLPVDSISNDINSMFNDHQKQVQEYKEMVELYKQQNLPALFEMIQRSKELGDNMGAFLDIRNEKWIERMVDKMDQHGVFFAVGAGHLWGETGLIQLLRKAGYMVSPVK